MYFHSGIATRFIGALLLISSAAAASVIELDFCRFQGAEAKTWLEVYIDLPRTAISHAEVEGGQFGAVRFEVQFLKDAREVSRDAWLRNDALREGEKVGSAQHLIEARGYLLTPGEYLVRVTAHDSLSGGKFDVQRAVSIRSYEGRQFDVSDVELASHLLPPDEHSPFNRGQFALLPSVSRIVTDQRPWFYYYLEIYPAVGAEVGEYHIQRNIMNGADTRKIELPEITLEGAPSAFSHLDSVSAKGLPGDTYNLNFRIVSPDGADALRQARFYLISNFSEEYIAAPRYDSLAVEAELAQMDYLLTGKQMRRSEKMSLTEKARFLDEFWRRYDDDPGTPDVPARRAFAARAANADEMFSESRREGHLTDRGRVYSLYGEPASREVHPHDISAKPYEIWFYDHFEGGVDFVFVDRSGLGEYSLVHSTARGELKAFDWYERFVDKSQPESRK